MNSNTGLEIVVIVSGDPGDDDYEEKFVLEKNVLLWALSEEGVVGKKCDVRIGNLGHGADWSVLIMTIATALLVIPEAHKRVREGIEEWMRIWLELSSLIQRVIGTRPALYPDEYLYGIALNHLCANHHLEEFTFRGFLRLPVEHIDWRGREDLLFSFEHEGKLYQVAVKRNGEFLWENIVRI